MMIRFGVCALGVFSIHAVGGVAMQDFIIADAQGAIFQVDGNTLAATQISQIQQLGFGFNEILYSGNNTIIANVNGTLLEHNFQTSEENEIFRILDQVDEPGIYYTLGLAELSSGNLFFSTQAIAAPPVVQTGAQWNPTSGSFTFGPQIETVNGLYFDHHEISANTIISADFSEQRILKQDIITGNTLEIFEVGYDVVSFFQQGDIIFSLSKQGDLFEFDPISGSSEFVGQVSGAGTSLVGATVPSPSGLAMLGFAGILCSRRRR